jgi:hypothetical protein
VVLAVQVAVATVQTIRQREFLARQTLAVVQEVEHTLMLLVLVVLVLLLFGILPLMLLVLPLLAEL